MFGIEKRLEERKGYAMTVLPLSYLNSLTSLSCPPLLLILSPLSHSLPSGGGMQVGSRRAARGKAAAGGLQGEGARGSPHGADLGVRLQGEGGAGPLAGRGAGQSSAVLQSVRCRDGGGPAPGGPSGRRPQQPAGDGRCVPASQPGDRRDDPATMEQLG